MTEVVLLDVCMYVAKSTHKGGGTQAHAPHMNLGGGGTEAGSPFEVAKDHLKRVLNTSGGPERT